MWYFSIAKLASGPQFQILSATYTWRKPYLLRDNCFHLQLRLVPAFACLWKVDTSMRGSSAFPAWSTPRSQILMVITACRNSVSMSSKRKRRLWKAVKLMQTRVARPSISNLNLNFERKLLMRCRCLHRLCVGSKRSPLNDVIIHFFHILNIMNNLHGIVEGSWASAGREYAHLHVPDVELSLVLIFPVGCPLGGGYNSGVRGNNLENWQND